MRAFALFFIMVSVEAQCTAPLQRLVLLHLYFSLLCFHF